MHLLDAGKTEPGSRAAHAPQWRGDLCNTLPHMLSLLLEDHARKHTNAWPGTSVLNRNAGTVSHTIALSRFANVSEKNLSMRLSEAVTVVLMWNH